MESVLLLGSAARGEAAIRQRGDSTEYFSDLEFLIVSNSRSRYRLERKVREAADRLERTLANPNPLFHIDFLIRHRRRISRLPPIIFTFELKKNGQVLSGRDVRCDIPEVSIENLDIRNTREIFFKRLFYILLYIPGQIFSAELSRAEKEVFGYALSRNALDLTTILLPEDGVLLSTYEDRVSFLSSSYENRTFSRRFGPSFPSFLESCLQMRSNIDFTNTNLEELYDAVVTYFDLVPRTWLPDLPGNAAIVCRKPPLFNEWPITRGEWYYLSRSLMKMARKSSLRGTLQWLFKPKKAWTCWGLLEMHQALRAWLRGDIKRADEEMARSADALGELTVPSRQDRSGTFEREWLALRRRWVDFYRFYLLADSEQMQRRMEFALEWPDDREAD